jgi:hypothetical protein
MVTPDGGTCGALPGDVIGNRATLRTKACPNGAGAVESGTLDLEAGDTLTVAAKSNFPRGGTSCTATTTGTLSRVQ